MEMRLRYAVRDYVTIDPKSFSPNGAALYLGYVLGISLEVSARSSPEVQVSPWVRFTMSFWLEYAAISGIDMDVVQGIGDQIITSYSKNLNFIAGVNVGRAVVAFYVAGKFCPEMILDLCRHYAPSAKSSDICEAISRYIGQPYKNDSGIAFITVPHAIDKNLEYAMPMAPSTLGAGISGGWINDPPIFHRILRKRFRLEEEANYWVLNNTGRTMSEADSGKVYVVYDDERKQWVLWLETWQQYFSRPHLCQTEQHVKALIAENHGKPDGRLQPSAENDYRTSNNLGPLVAGAIFLVFLVWQLFRLFV